MSDYEIVLKQADGSPIFCLETAQSIRDGSGSIIELQGTIKDISERIKNEQEIWKTNMELVESNMKLKQTQQLMVQQEKLASIGQLAAGIAHEINNPLGFLKSNHGILAKFIGKIRKAWEEASEIADGKLAEIGRKHDLEYIFSEIDNIFGESEDGYARIMRIIANLKNFARIDQSADFDTYDMNSGIESTLVVAWNEIKYVADVQKDLGDIPAIQARGGEVNQVILNLLVNAAQAIEGQKRPAKGLIEIKTYAKGDKVYCRIRDDGPGIPETIRQRIFDPFFTTKEPGKGTGLGLSISYNIIVTVHGGKISVESAVGVGSTFTIELPLKKT
jgi:two-component system, NtrC family, sensor kinase